MVSMDTEGIHRVHSGHGYGKWYPWTSGGHTQNQRYMTQNTYQSETHINMKMNQSEQHLRPFWARAVEHVSV